MDYKPKQLATIQQPAGLNHKVIDEVIDRDSRPMNVKLETERLLLAEWQPEFWQDFYRIASDPQVMRHIGMGKPWTEEQARTFVTRQIEHAAAHGYCLWALVEKQSGRLIGHTGLKQLGTTGEVEIGWWLARDRWGNGLATEAAQRVLRFGLQELKLRRVLAVAQPANAASIAIMKKLGMGLLRRARHADLGFKNPDIEVVIYVKGDAEGIAIATGSLMPPSAR